MEARYAEATIDEICGVKISNEQMVSLLIKFDGNPAEQWLPCKEIASKLSPRLLDEYMKCEKVALNTMRALMKDTNDNGSAVEEVAAPSAIGAFDIMPPTPNESLVLSDADLLPIYLDVEERVHQMEADSPAADKMAAAAEAVELPAMQNATNAATNDAVDDAACDAVDDAACDAVDDTTCAADADKQNTGPKMQPDILSPDEEGPIVSAAEPEGNKEAADTEDTGDESDANTEITIIAVVHSEMNGTLDHSYARQGSISPDDQQLEDQENDEAPLAQCKREEAALDMPDLQTATTSDIPISNTSSQMVSIADGDEDNDTPIEISDTDSDADIDFELELEHGRPGPKSVKQKRAVSAKLERGKQSRKQSMKLMTDLVPPPKLVADSGTTKRARSMAIAEHSNAENRKSNYVLDMDLITLLESDVIAEEPERKRKKPAAKKRGSNANGDQDVYSVEMIVAHRKSGRTTEYLIKWEGYDESQNTWEPASNVSPDVIEEYFEQQD